MINGRITWVGRSQKKTKNSNRVQYTTTAIVSPHLLISCMKQGFIKTTCYDQQLFPSLFYNDHFHLKDRAQTLRVAREGLILLVLKQQSKKSQKRRVNKGFRSLLSLYPSKKLRLYVKFMIPNSNTQKFNKTNQ